MQFADLRVLLRLPDANFAPNVGCNFTAAAMMTNLISGFSIWFFHNRYARSLESQEKKARQALSAKRFRGFVRAYYPRQLLEPTAVTIANYLYDARNVLSHNLGVDGTKVGRSRSLDLGVRALPIPQPALVRRRAALAARANS